MRVELGILDPERWRRAFERDEITEDQVFGTEFGTEAEVYLSQRSGDGSWEVEVGQGSIGCCYIAKAERRADTYAQAINMAKFIRTQLDAGTPLDRITKFLTVNLPQTPQTATDTPFTYKA